MVFPLKAINIHAVIQRTKAFTYLLKQLNNRQIKQAIINN